MHPCEAACCGDATPWEPGPAGALAGGGPTMPHTPLAFFLDHCLKHAGMAGGCCRGNGMGDGAVSAPLDPPTTTFGDDRSRAGPQLVIPAHAGIQKVDPGLKPAGVTGSGCLRGNDGRVHRPATAARQAGRAGTRGSGIRHPPRRRASGISSPSWKKARKSGVNGP